MKNSNIINIVNDNSYLEYKNQGVHSYLCKCSIKININSVIFDIKKHLNTKKHKNNIDYVIRNKQDSIHGIQNTKNFYESSVKMI